MIQVYKIFKAVIKIFMSSVDTTSEKEVVKQYKAQTSPYQASVTHNNKLRPNGGSRRRAVGAIAA